MCKISLNIGFFFSNDQLLTIATNTVEKLIKDKKNLFPEIKKSKAIIHTWLVWQERPGTLLGNAITYQFIKNQEHILSMNKASTFIQWLQKLFKD